MSVTSSQCRTTAFIYKEKDCFRKWHKKWLSIFSLFQRWSTVLPLVPISLYSQMKVTPQGCFARNHFQSNTSFQEWFISPNHLRSTSKILIAKLKPPQPGLQRQTATAGSPGPALSYTLSSPATHIPLMDDWLYMHKHWQGWAVPI